MYYLWIAGNLDRGEHTTDFTAGILHTVPTECTESPVHRALDERSAHTDTLILFLFLSFCALLKLSKAK